MKPSNQPRLAVRMFDMISSLFRPSKHAESRAAAPERLDRRRPRNPASPVLSRMSRHRSKYSPHQGNQEKARRLRQTAAGIV